MILLRGYAISKAVQKFVTNTKLWITGHSRGGAVANLLAAELTRLARNNNPLALATQNNIYTYTYATPNVKVPEMGTPSETSEQMRDRYLNIFNIVINQDFVTQVPLERWGYTKYGQTAKLSFSPNIMISSAYVNTGRLGYTIKPNKTRGGLSSFAKAAPTVDEYYNGQHYTVRVWRTLKYRFRPPLFDVAYDFIGGLASGEYKNNFGGVLTTTGARELIDEIIENAVSTNPLLTISQGRFMSVALFFAKNQNDTILYAHNPETYVALNRFRYNYADSFR
jgi:hypothetical protein